MSALNIDDMTQQERYDALGKLLRLHVGAVKLDGPEDDWCVVFNEEVKPRCVATIAVPPYVKFDPRKLVIMEPVREIVSRETFSEHKPVLIEKRKTWYGRETMKVTEAEVTVRSLEHKSEAVQKRGIWIVQSALVGSRVQFPSQKGIGGDAFGPDGDLKFRTVCEPGLHITLVVENTTDYPARFLAVLVGKCVDKQMDDAKAPPVTVIDG